MLYKNSQILLRCITKPIKKISTKLYSTEPPLLIEETGDKAMIILNRAKVLNAMDISLSVELYNTLKTFEDQKSIIILKSVGDKSFTSGRDLQEIEVAAKSPTFKHRLNYIGCLNTLIYLIQTYHIPIVTFMHGNVFEGGAGISKFSKYSIATEETKFALPEVRLGFHPNAGATNFLNQVHGKLGYYLALTGNTLWGSDTVRAGFASHFCKSNNLKKLETQLLCNSNPDYIKDIINTICEKQIAEFSLDPYIDTINVCFSEPTIENIILKLNKDGSEWAKETVKAIEKCSPSSLKVTLKSIQMGKNMDLKECLFMESILSYQFYEFSDLLEGTSVALQHKNGPPQWSPPKLNNVADELVGQYFQPMNFTSNDIQNELFLQRYA